MKVVSLADSPKLTSLRFENHVPLAEHPNVFVIEGLHKELHVTLLQPLSPTGGCFVLATLNKAYKHIETSIYIYIYTHRYYKREITQT